MITGDFRRREKYLKFPCYFLKCLYIYNKSTLAANATYLFNDGETPTNKNNLF